MYAKPIYAIELFSLVSGVVLDPWDFKLYEQFATGAVSHSWQLEVGGVSSAAKTLPTTFGVGLLFLFVPCLTL